MTNYLYILVILYNLNLLINLYTKIMIKIITIFNYKNTSEYTNNFFFFDIMTYNLYQNKNVLKLLLAVR